ncbi:conserved hypothetical protein, secreted [Candidatus Magnetomorum sp. HK-1]|nr:conserved hypothetical protein, secreted [Candidatus Magnetomorum sp. HK-1]
MILLLRFLLPLLLYALIFVAPIWADSAREIMQKVFDRYEGNTEINISTLTTYRYAVKDGKDVCIETPRVITTKNIRKNYGPRLKDIKTILIIMSPPRDRGISFLQHDYEQKEADQWIYLSTFKKLKRIISGNENEPKIGCIFGSEISYEDMEKKYIHFYTYKTIKTITYRKRPCVIIECLPTPEQSKKSNYSKEVRWIDTEHSLTLKAVLFNRQGKKVKRIIYRKLELVDGIMWCHQMRVKNYETLRKSVWDYNKIKFNIPVTDAFISQRTLLDKAFREKNLTNMEKYLE